MEQPKDERREPTPQQGGSNRDALTRDAARGAGRQALLEDAKKSRREPPEQDERGPRKKHKRLNRFLFRVLGVVVLLLIVAVAVAVLTRNVRESLSFDVQLPDSFAALLPDEKMGYTRTDFVDAILGQTREKAELVVLEQDVQVTTQISQALANIALFEKTQTLISYGTGVYAVDLSGVGAAQIELLEAEKTVVVTIPHATLLYVNFDVTRTESGETHRALFAFGDIKLTPEQDTVLKTSIEEAMREKLGSPEALAAADERALVAVRDLLAPLVRGVSDAFYVKVVMEPAA